MVSFDYLLMAGAGLTAFIGLMLLLKRVLVTSMAIKTLIYSLPFG